MSFYAGLSKQNDAVDRNFAWVLGNIREHANGWYVWTTTDGDFQGGVWHTNEEKETVYPLFQRP